MRCGIAEIATLARATHDDLRKHARSLSPESGLACCSYSSMLKPQFPSDDPQTYSIIGAAIEVHRVLGAGFLEVFYKDALAIELMSRDIAFRREVLCNIQYKGHRLRGDYKMDFVCFDQVVLEIKARSNTGLADHAQVISYLASSRLRVGLLLNFGGPKLEYKRFVWTPHEDRIE
jgi:GxxExxY protein